MERKVFLEILDRFKDVIERKKSDNTSLKEKEVAWKEICTTYNESAIITQQRTTQQLKKLWANIKQQQRDAITKERQSRMATGGGPEESKVDIDPDVALIAPNLMKTAPVLFTSNMTEEEINNKYDVFDLTADDFQSLNNEDEPAENDIATISWKDTSTARDNREQCDNNRKQHDTKRTTACEEQYDTIGDIVHLHGNKSTVLSAQKEKKRKLTKLSAEDTIRIERIKKIMSQEEQLAAVQLTHEKRISVLKEEHLIEMNRLQFKHAKELHEKDLQIRKARLRNVELQQKENIEPDM